MADGHDRVPEEAVFLLNCYPGSYEGILTLLVEALRLLDTVLVKQAFH